MLSYSVPLVSFAPKPRVSICCHRYTDQAQPLMAGSTQYMSLLIVLRKTPTPTQQHKLRAQVRSLPPKLIHPTTMQKTIFHVVFVLGALAVAQAAIKQVGRGWPTAIIAAVQICVCTASRSPVIALNACFYILRTTFFVLIAAGGLVQLWWSTAARQAFQQQLLPTLLLPGEH